MRCGISTACFFPDNVLDGLRQVVETGAPVTEVFLGTFNELEEEFVAKMQKIAENSGVRVAYVHPFSSMIEGFYFASHYEGRLDDGLKLYRRYFEVCKRLGADKLVFHGDHNMNVAQYPVRQYAQNFKALAALGRENGVTLCHENVYYCRLTSPEDAKLLTRLLGNDAAFVLDTKQVLRGGGSVKAMVDAMGRRIRHIHISDRDKGEDYLPPGQGGFSFEALIDSLRAHEYDGDMVIEVYRDNFLHPADLKAAMEYVNALIQEK